MLENSLVGLPVSRTDEHCPIRSTVLTERRKTVKEIHADKNWLASFKRSGKTERMSSILRRIPKLNLILFTLIYV